MAQVEGAGTSTTGNGLGDPYGSGPGYSQPATPAPAVAPTPSTNSSSNHDSSTPTPVVATAPKFKGKDGKDYPTQEAATAADVAFDADVKARTGVDGVVYPTLEQKVSADKVTSDEKAMGEIKAPTEANIMERAQNLSSTAQAGAVSSAGGAARAAGMSPAQAALMGSSAGSSTYQNTIESSYGKAGDLELQSYTSQIQSALSKYATDVSAKTGLRGQDLQKYMSDKGNEIALKLGQMGLDAQKQKDIMSGLGYVLQAGAWILSTFLAKGADYTAEGDYIVGEEGPEIVHLPQGASVDPHDGYEMLAKAHREAMPRLAKYKMDEFSPPPYETNPMNGLGDKLQGYLAYLKGGK